MGRVGDTSTIYVCPSGHETEVLGWGRVPAKCPHCKHGKPCDQPLTKKGKTK